MSFNEQEEKEFNNKYINTNINNNLTKKNNRPIKRRKKSFKS